MTKPLACAAVAASLALAACGGEAQDATEAEVSPEPLPAERTVPTQTDAPPADDAAEEPAQPDGDGAAPDKMVPVETPH